MKPLNRVAGVVAVVMLTFGAVPTARQAAPGTGGAASAAAFLDVPFASQLVASPVGARVAWVFDIGGARNVWVADGPQFAGRALTSYTGDTGQDITSLQWTPDGQHLVFVRGGGPNRAGEFPNPTSDPGGVEQAIWIVPASGGEPRRLGTGDAPVVSPKGDTVAFLQRGQVWTAGVNGTPAASQLFRARGSARGLTFSPDGVKLAFSSARGGHAYVAIYDLTSKALRFLDPSVDSDLEPAWSPDGRWLAFIREPVDSSRIPFHAVREAEPWSIRVADVAAGTSKEVWRAERGRGSVFQGVSGDALLWTASNDLVFPWERTGWKLLYSVPAAGGRATVLTPGEGEVEDVLLAPDRKTIYYNTNHLDIDRRHVWKVTPGAAPQQLTSGRTIEWSAAPLADGTGVAYFQADARKPGQPVVQMGAAAARALAAASIPASFPAASFVEPQAVTISAADGMRIPAQLFVPASPAPGGRHPAVIFFHGGSRRQMLLGWHYLSYYHATYAFNQLLAARGYVVLSVNYRSGIGYGLDFREAVNYGASGASEYNDVIGAGLYLRSRADVDPARIGVWGGSYGGYLTAMALSRSPEMFAAGVDFHGVHDWTVVIRNFQPSFNPEAQPEVARRAFLSSPMSSIDGWKAPVLVVHGDDDRNVPFSETVDLVEQLRKRRVPVEQLVFPDEVHGFLLRRNWVNAFTAAADFFDRHLRASARVSQ